MCAFDFRLGDMCLFSFLLHRIKLDILNVFFLCLFTLFSSYSNIKFANIYWTMCWCVQCFKDFQNILTRPPHQTHIWKQFSNPPTRPPPHQCIHMKTQPGRQWTREQQIIHWHESFTHCRTATDDSRLDRRQCRWSTGTNLSPTAVCYSFWLDFL